MEGISSLGFRFAAATSAGIGYKPQNEDRIVIDAQANLYAVIDGMGGHRGGEEAAQLLAEKLRSNPTKPMEAMQDAHVEMRTLPYGAGACISTVNIRKMVPTNGLNLEGIHGGDVKRLIIQNRSTILQNGLPYFEESTDHDMVRGLSREEIRVHPYRNAVLGYISADRFKGEEMSTTLSPGSMVLLYSDGVGDNIPDAQEMVRLSLQKSASQLLAAVQAIVEKKMTEYTDDRAKREDMKRDNWSFVAIEIPSGA